MPTYGSRVGSLASYVHRSEGSVTFQTTPKGKSQDGPQSGGL